MNFKTFIMGMSQDLPFVVCGDKIPGGLQILRDRPRCPEKSPDGRSVGTVTGADAALRQAAPRGRPGFQFHTQKRNAREKGNVTLLPPSGLRAPLHDEYVPPAFATSRGPLHPATPTLNFTGLKWDLVTYFIVFYLHLPAS